MRASKTKMETDECRGCTFVFVRFALLYLLNVSVVKHTHIFNQILSLFSNPKLYFPVLQFDLLNLSCDFVTLTLAALKMWVGNFICSHTHTHTCVHTSDRNQDGK